MSWQDPPTKGEFIFGAVLFVIAFAAMLIWLPQ